MSDMKKKNNIYENLSLFYYNVDIKAYVLFWQFYIARAKLDYHIEV